MKTAKDKAQKPKPKQKERILLLAPVKETGMHTHFVVHELIQDKEHGTRLSLIAADSPEHAKEIDMDYNKVNSNLPPYTFKVYYSAQKQRLQERLAATLSELGEKYKGHYKVLFVNGWESNDTESIYLHI
jgi:hypothetical protein